jgi:ABC-2 type transport system ATP-binding protein
MRTTEDQQLGLVGANRREVVVKLRAVSHYFDHLGFVRALNNVSFEVRRGEIFGLIGPAGSGKSTVIRILAGQFSPSGGKAKVMKCSPRRRAAKARIGYLPQNLSHAHSHWFVGIGRFFRMFVGWPKTDTGTASIKTAEKERRTILKRLLIKQSDLVLLDDPFTGMDAANSAEMKGYIRALARHGRTVVLTSRSLIFTKDICERLAVLCGGRIEAVGTLPELVATRDSLSYIGDVLPSATAERLLELIRQDLGLADLPGDTRTEAPKGTSLPPDADNRQLISMKTLAFSLSSSKEFGILYVILVNSHIVCQSAQFLPRHETDPGRGRLAAPALAAKEGHHLARTQETTPRLAPHHPSAAQSVGRPGQLQLQ